ncbi:hypothetical protein [Alicyclobacillus sp. SO9]|uniref:hypothetical protein n=1 Tax=Alicyclobacillus sp. SO9 TaxID=2665646 RepID=UPI0018E79D79|nr:hypothetical protein [Alicyclobacillus sp. SO9]QQE77179.1 hypothetical protein GI364_14515 [Alicyclobacillus sp. SO9]
MPQRKLFLKTLPFLIGAGALFVAVADTFSQPQAAPVKSHYSVQFSIRQPQAKGATSGQTVQTSIELHIRKWDPNYDKTRYQVFLIFTSVSTNVMDVYDNSSGKFVFGGWYNFGDINRILKQHKLSPVPNNEGEHTWLYVSSQAPFSSRIIATTRTVPQATNWRIAVIAEQRQNSNISILWSKVYRPASP